MPANIKVVFPKWMVDKAKEHFYTQGLNSLKKIGFQIERNAKISMKKGGYKLYRRGKNREILHYSSFPGQPPAVDSGRLRASVTTNWSGSKFGRTPSKGVVKRDRIRGDRHFSRGRDGVGRPKGSMSQAVQSGRSLFVVTGTNIKYGWFLEFGTKFLIRRPWLRPAFYKATYGNKGLRF